MFLQNRLKNSPKYMNPPGFITTLPLQRGTNVLKLTRMVGIGTFEPTIPCTNVGVSSNLYHILPYFIM